MDLTLADVTGLPGVCVGGLKSSCSVEDGFKPWTRTSTPCSPNTNVYEFFAQFPSACPGSTVC